MHEGDHRRLRAQAAGARAARERRAIGIHERAVELHGWAATVLEQAALTELDAGRADRMADRAAGERILAARAADRAQAARARLAADGVSPEG